MSWFSECGESLVRPRGPRLGSAFELSGIVFTTCNHKERLVG